MIREELAGGNLRYEAYLGLPADAYQERLWEMNLASEEFFSRRAWIEKEAPYRNDRTTYEYHEWLRTLDPEFDAACQRLASLETQLAEGFKRQVLQGLGFLLQGVIFNIPFGQGEAGTYTVQNGIFAPEYAFTKGEFIDRWNMGLGIHPSFEPEWFKVSDEYLYLKPRVIRCPRLEGRIETEGQNYLFFLGFGECTYPRSLGIFPENMHSAGFTSPVHMVVEIPADKASLMDQVYSFITEKNPYNPELSKNILGKSFFDPKDLADLSKKPA